MGRITDEAYASTPARRLRAGNHREHKNLETLLRAFSRVAAADPDPMLVLCGQDRGSLRGVVPGRGALPTMDKDREARAMDVSALEGEGCMEPESHTIDGGKVGLIV